MAARRLRARGAWWAIATCAALFTWAGPAAADPAPSPSPEWAHGPHEDHTLHELAAPTLDGSVSTPTNDPTPVITGGGKGGAFVVVSVGGTGCQATVSNHGTWSCSLGSPLAPGAYTLDAKQGAVHGSATFWSPAAHATLTIVGGDAPPPAPEPTPDPTPTHGKGSKPAEDEDSLTFDFSVLDATGNIIVDGEIGPGQVVRITGHDLPPTSRVRVELHSTPRLLGTTFVAADGTFELVTAIPSDISPGTHTIVVYVYPPHAPGGAQEMPVTIGDDALEEVVLGASGPEPVVGPAAPPASEPGTGLNDSSEFGTSLPGAHDIHLDGEHLALTGGLSALLLLLFVLPGRLLEGTLSHNYWRIEDWLARGRRRITARAPRFGASLRAGGNLWGEALASWKRGGPGVVALAVGATALILGFSDPHFGFNGASFRLFLAIALSLCIINLAGNVTARVIASSAFDAPASFVPMPAVLPVTAGAVLISRLLHIQPGLLLGLVIGVSVTRQLSRTQEARLALAHAGTLLGLGLGSWIGYAAFTAQHHHEGGFWYHLVEEVLAAGSVEALLGFLVVMLPLTFMEGHAVFEWSRRTWAFAYLAGLAVVVTLVIPMAGEFSHWKGNAVVLTLALVGFAVFALAVWYAFERLEEREAHAEPAPATAPARQGK